MLSLDFYNPTRIILGRGRIAELDRHISQDARVLVLYGGGSVERNGTLEQVRTSLGQRHVQYFSGIEPNPTYETLIRAVKQVRSEQLDFLLAVGGGSVIDGTKFVAAAVPFAGEPWDILLAGGSNVQQALPLASVLTLPATGSEMNSGAVITRAASQIKLHMGADVLFPQFSILDPATTFSLPLHQVANGVVDAFVHVIEQYLTLPGNNPVQDRFAEGLLQTLIEIGPSAVQQPDNEEVRANLMWVASLALNGLTGAGVPQDWSTHLLGHELTALYGLDHAQTLAVILPSMLQVRRAAKRDKLLQYAERVWGLSKGTEEQRIDAAITNTRSFFEQVGVATRLAAYQLDETCFDPVLEQLQANGMTALGELGEVTPEVCRQVLQLSL